MEESEKIHVNKLPTTVETYSVSRGDSYVWVEVEADENKRIHKIRLYSSGTEAVLPNLWVKAVLEILKQGYQL
jgi:hypothetical protein